MKDIDTGEALARANVRVELLATGEVIAETTSDSSGAFLLDRLPARRVCILAAKSGYVNGASGSILYTNTDVEPAPITLYLAKAAVVAGHVLDDSGQPATSVRVFAIPGGSAGRFSGAELRNPGVAVDDQGAYRLYGLPPGHYRIAAMGDAGGPDAVSPVYFPGTGEADRAKVILLHAGEVLQSVNVMLTKRIGSLVSGKVIGIPDAWPRQAVVVSLVPRGGRSQASAITRCGNEGAFRFDGVPAGSYDLVAAGPVSGVFGLEAVLGENPLYGRKSVDLPDPAGGQVDILLGPGGSLQGYVTFDPPSHPDALCLAGTKVLLSPVDAAPPAAPPSTQVYPDGSFRFRGLLDVLYRVSVRVSSDKCVPEWADGTGEARIVRTGEKALHVVLTARGAQISGAVDGIGAGSGAAVILAPIDGSTVLTQESTVALVSPDGKYRVDGVPPGRYRVMAVERLNSVDFLDPAFWSEHKDRTVDVFAGPDSAHSVTLKAVVPHREGQ